jgi:hypothetical protein
MPLNLIKTYNTLLDIAALTESQRKQSLMGVFNRDIANNTNFKFLSKQITPTPLDGVIKMETLYSHLTTVIVDKEIKQRAFDIHRACRLHWIKYHIEQKKTENMLLFSVNEPQGNRTYLYDKDEKYVIILEPLKSKNEYYLLTAYHLTGKDAARDKIIKKYKRGLKELL